MMELYYLRKGRGIPLVFVHGYLGGASQWASQINYFSQTFDVISINLPGFGDSDKTLKAIHSIDDFAQIILQKLMQLNIQKFILLGHSMGGMIAQQIAQIAPKHIYKLILYSTGAFGVLPSRFESIEASRKKIQENGLEETLKRTIATWFIAGSKHKNYKTLVDIGLQASTSAAMGALTAMENWDGYQALDKIKTPTLIVWGDQDRSYSWHQIETLWQNLPNAQLAVIPNTSHAVHLEKPHLFKVLLEDFIDEYKLL